MTDLVCDFRHFSTSFVPDEYNCFFYLILLMSLFVKSKPVGHTGVDCIYIIWQMNVYPCVCVSPPSTLVSCRYSTLVPSWCCVNGRLLTAVFGSRLRTASEMIEWQKTSEQKWLRVCFHAFSWWDHTVARWVVLMCYPMIVLGRQDCTCEEWWEVNVFGKDCWSGSCLREEGIWKIPEESHDLVKEDV